MDREENSEFEKLAEDGWIMLDQCEEVEKYKAARVRETNTHCLHHLSQWWWVSTKSPVHYGSIPATSWLCSTGHTQNCTKRENWWKLMMHQQFLCFLPYIFKQSQQPPKLLGPPDLICHPVSDWSPPGTLQWANAWSLVGWNDMSSTCQAWIHGVSWPPGLNVLGGSIWVANCH